MSKLENYKYKKEAVKLYKELGSVKKVADKLAEYEGGYINYRYMSKLLKLEGVSVAHKGGGRVKGEKDLYFRQGSKLKDLIDLYNKGNTPFKVAQVLSEKYFKKVSQNTVLNILRENNIQIRPKSFYGRPKKYKKKDIKQDDISKNIASRYKQLKKQIEKYPEKKQELIEQYNQELFNNA